MFSFPATIIFVTVSGEEQSLLGSGYMAKKARAQNWNIEIYAADGKLVQRNYYPLSNLVHVDFDRKFAKGTYFVRAINYMAGKTYSSSFVVKD